MDRFLPYTDELGNAIEAGAAELYKRMQNIRVAELGMPEHCLHYFQLSHSRRLFFSIETSAHILYRSISLTGKAPASVVLMDYGAGVGSLFLLAKLIGCQKVVYNDHLEDWKKSAQILAEAVGLSIDHYIVGDIHDCLNKLGMLDIHCDIIASRNVIEHIYKLDEFYKAIAARQPQALVFSSTTANQANPASVLKHRLWHRKWEKIYRGKRSVAIERQSPGMSAHRKLRLAKASRGLALDDLSRAIDEFRKTGRLPDPSVHGSNTCDPSNGVWAEHLISARTYRRLIGENQFSVQIYPGFWDTHYNKPYMNTVGRILNRIIARGGNMALRVAPFIYVVAQPRSSRKPVWEKDQE